MSKQVQILLSRPLTVNLGTDGNGQAITHKLAAGLQQVDAEIADNWFVKAHCQEISNNDIQTGELQKQLEIVNEELSILQTQSDEATKKIGQLEGIVKERDTEIANLKIQLTKTQQEQSDAAKTEIGILKDQLKARDTEIAKLKADAAKAAPAKEKDVPKET
jgi:chromosome segregation ATPase